MKLAPYIQDNQQVQETCRMFEARNPEIKDYYVFKLGGYYRVTCPTYQSKMNNIQRDWPLKTIFKGKKIWKKKN